ncbi:MAG: CidA/LrgA family protein [Firmicutes bacterium]|nr:CidA/LrgA family protein [Bacillota bacterium]
MTAQAQWLHVDKHLRRRVKLWRLLATVVQIAVLWLVAALCTVLSTALHLPIPGSIVGFALVFILLKSGLLPIAWIERGAQFLLGELLLFFVPSAVGVVQFSSVVRAHGLVIYLIIFVGTALVMTVTGLSSERIARRVDPPSVSTGHTGGSADV